MQLLCFGFEDRHKHQGSFSHYLNLRQKIFVEELGWPLATDGCGEQDQYDNPHAKYVLLHNDQTVMAGARLLPDTANWNGWRHMASDTRDGKITTMDRNVICPALNFDGVWECSRLLMNTTVLEGEPRRHAFVQLTHAIVAYVAEQGARSVISISPPSLRRVLTEMGYKVETVGPIFVDRFDGRRYRAFQMVDLPNTGAAL